MLSTGLTVTTRGTLRHRQTLQITDTRSKMKFYYIYYILLLFGVTSQSSNVHGSILSLLDNLIAKIVFLHFK